MADATITLPDGSKVDNTSLTRADATTVYRQRVSLGDEDGIMQQQNRLLQELIFEVRDLKWKLLSALH
jgi:hypothetical protein